MLAFAQFHNFVPLVAPIDTAATAKASPWLALKNALSGAFLVFFGVITAASADQAVTVTVEAATAAASGSEAAIAFTYRLSAAAGANTWGSRTSSASTGLSIATTDDGRALWVEIDPATVQAAKTDATHVRVVVTPDAAGTVTLLSVWGILDPAYKQVTMESAT